jgi:hypothetical protein
METPTMTHFKTLKRILWYIKCIIDFGFFMDILIALNLWVIVIVIMLEICMIKKKNITGFVFYMGDTTFIESSKKQPIVTLSTCEVEYVATTTCVCHSIWLRRLLKKLWMS